MRTQARTEAFKSKVYALLWNMGKQNGSPTTRILKNPVKPLAESMRVTTVTVDRYVNMLISDGCLERKSIGVYEIRALDGSSSDLAKVGPSFFIFDDLVAYYRDSSPSGLATEFIGASLEACRVRERIVIAASLDKPTLITGETGVGKGLVAQLVHSLSARRDKAFHAINCGAIPETLLESELFGHDAGSFTGASSKHRGWFERADGACVFLDEIGDSTPAFQVKLLRVLDDGTFFRVGGEQKLHTNVRVLAATNVDLVKAVEEGKFREDLYYRLYGIAVHVPPLRERPDDILHLAAYFVAGWETKHRSRYTFQPEVLAALSQHLWRGNVRELNAVLEVALLLARDKIVGTEHLEFSPLSLARSGS